jgi:hypothetical protein
LGASSGNHFSPSVFPTRICDDTTDLPGALAGCAFRPTSRALNFDGPTIVFSTTKGDGSAAGVYRATTAGGITKLLDSADLLVGPQKLVSVGDVDVEGGLVFAVLGNTTLANRVTAFESDGTRRFISLGTFLFAGGPRQVFFGEASFIARWTDGKVEPVVQVNDLLDCRRVQRCWAVDAQGDDVAVGLSFTDGSAGIFANFSAGPAGLKLGVPTLVSGQMRFAVPTQAGKTYAVQFRTSLNAGGWSVLLTISGDGTVKTVSVGAAGTSGFCRLAESTP